MKQRLVLLTIAVILAIGSIYLTDSYVKAQLNEVQVVVVKKDLPAYHQLTADDLSISSVSTNGVHAKAVHSIDTAISKYLKAEVVEGEILLDSKVVTISDLPKGYLYELDLEERVFAIKTDLVKSVGGIVKADDWVDVIAVTQSPNQEVNSQTILKKIRVLDVRSSEALPIDKVEDKTQIIDTGNENIPAAVLVAVESQQAEKIAMYQQIGQIYLSIHPKQSVEVRNSFTDRGVSDGKM